MPTRKRPTVDLPGTIERSPQKAQDTYRETLVSAIEQYGDGERAHRTALASLKHSFEKVGDHWEEKDHKGPSDERAESDNRDGGNRGRSGGGVDVEGHTKAELYDRAKALDVQGRSTMDKYELAQAIARAQD